MEEAPRAKIRLWTATQPPERVSQRMLWMMTARSVLLSSLLLSLCWLLAPRLLCCAGGGGDLALRVCRRRRCKDELGDLATKWTGCEAQRRYQTDGARHAHEQTADLQQTDAQTQSSFCKQKRNKAA